MILHGAQQTTLHALGERIAQARRARNMGQSMMATLAGIGLSTVVAIEAGKPGVAIGNVLRVIDALGLMEQVDRLLHPSRDDVVVQLAVRSLPKRAHPSRGRRKRISA